MNSTETLFEKMFIGRTCTHTTFSYCLKNKISHLIYKSADYDKIWHFIMSNIGQANSRFLPATNAARTFQWLVKILEMTVKLIYIDFCKSLQFVLQSFEYLHSCNICWYLLSHEYLCMCRIQLLFLQYLLLRQSRFLVPGTQGPWIRD